MKVEEPEFGPWTDIVMILATDLLQQFFRCWASVGQYIISHLVCQVLKENRFT